MPQQKSDASLQHKAQLHKKPIRRKKKPQSPPNKAFSFLFAAKNPKKTEKTKPVKKSATREKTPRKEMSPARKITIFLVVAAFSIFAFIATVSHIFTWETQDNACGPLGYKLGDVIVGQWFGIWGFLLPLLLLLATILLMNKKLPGVRKICASTLFALAIFPFITAFIASNFEDTFCGGVGVGGGFGSTILMFGRETIGTGGLVIASIVLTLLWVLYSIPKSEGLFLKSSKAVTDKVFKASEEQPKKKAPLNKEDETNPFVDEEEEYEEEEEEIDEEEEDDIEEEQQLQQSAREKLMKETAERGRTLYVDVEEQIRAFGESENMLEEVEEEDDVPMIDVPTAEEEEVVTPLIPDDDGVDFEIAVTGNSVVTDGEGLNVKYNIPDEMEESDIAQEVYDPTRELSNYKLPPISLLNDRAVLINVSAEEKAENKRKIVSTLKDFGINIESIRVTAGPTVTLYEIVPASGVRISKIKNLEDNIALSLSALGIRIIAPMPGKGTIGIEVPNKNTEIVSMYSVLKSKQFQESTAELPIVMGRTIQNEDYVFDLAKAPHLLVAGATGQGKSVGLNVIMASLLYKKHPAELKFVLVDPKKVELALYKNIEKHYLAKLPDAEEAIITDTDKVIHTLNSLCIEMDERYSLLKMAKVVRIKDYNEKFKNRRLNPNKGHRFLPYFVVIIDEFADLIMTAGKEIETPISRIAQLARAVGIHLVIATQRPTVNIITGVIKANFPTRIAFRVTSSIDSKTILDHVGANQLIGCGDMLVSNGNELTRVQCAFIDTPEVEKVTEYIGEQQGYPTPYELPEFVAETKDKDNDNGGYGESITQRRDVRFDEIARYVVQNQQGSASTIQRNFSIGFNRAGRIMDQLEKAGIVGPQHGSKPRNVLITDVTALELHMIDLDRQNYRQNN